MRSILFWVLLGSMDRDWWARFLDRYGSPFLVGKYDQGDDQSRTILERAFSAAVRIGGLVISKETNVELIQAAQGNAGDAYEKFYTISRREISKLIVGQTLSGDAQPTGLGSGVAKFHSDVRDDYRKFDAAMLGESLKHGLFAQFLQINGVSGEVPGITWGSTSTEESEVTGALLSSLAQAGLRVADSGLEAISEKVGFQIERMPAAPAAALPGNLTGFSVVPMTRLERADAAVDDISRAGAANLAQAFRGSLAPVRQMILDSTSAEDLQKRILQGYSTWESGKVTEILEQALVAFSANGVAR
jgi:phage gp29-like protein